MNRQACETFLEPELIYPGNQTWDGQYNKDINVHIVTLNDH